MIGPLNFIAQDPVIFVVLVLFFLAGLILRGALQARLAARLGDPEGLELGYASLEPPAHFGWWGLIWYLLLGCALPRPLPLTVRGRRGLAVALSGPLFLLAWCLLLLLFQHLQTAFAASLDVVGRGLELAAQASALHALFFVLPLPALDGFQALWALGGPGLRRTLAQSQRAGLVPTYLVWLLLSLSGALVAVQLPLMTLLKSLYALLPF